MTVETDSVLKGGIRVVGRTNKVGTEAGGRGGNSNSILLCKIFYIFLVTVIMGMLTHNYIMHKAEAALWHREQYKTLFHKTIVLGRNSLSCDKFQTRGCYFTSMLCKW